MRDRPPRASPQHKLEWPGGVVPEWARPQGGRNKRRGKGRGGPGGPGGGGGGKRERLQKVMAQSGHGSRRNIEILIAQGHLTINGQLAKLGDSVGPSDKVKLDGRLLNLRFGEQLPRVLVYHKPAGEIVTRDDPEKRPTVFDKLPRVNGGRWVSVGRLDFNTEGLLIFTTSGELANRLTHPRFEVEREYAVRVMGEVSEEQQAKLLNGVDIDGEPCKFDSLQDRGGEGSNHWYHVVLREGKNREVRRMMEAVGLMVSRLIRVRFGSVELPGHVKRGMLREMDEEQVQNLLQFAGMNEPEPGESAASEEDDEEVEDEHDNIGNRAPDPAREARHREEAHVDDNIGNRFDPNAEAENIPDDHIGNRGTYGEGFTAPSQKAPRRPQGKQPFFKKSRGQGGNPQYAGGQPQGNAQHAHGAPQGQGQGQGPQGEGKRHKRRRGGKNRNRGGGMQAQGNQAQGNQAQGNQQQQPMTAWTGEGQPPQQQHARPQGQGQGQAQPGQGKPGRHRRHKNRNRNRGAAEGRTEQQPATNTNREPV